MTFSNIVTIISAISIIGNIAVWIYLIWDKHNN